MARAVVAVVALVVAVPVVVEERAHLAHKLLHPLAHKLVRLQAAVVLVPLPPQAEVAALLLGQGLAASESLGRR